MTLRIPDNLRTASKLDFIRGIREVYGSVSDEFTARPNLAFCVDVWNQLQADPNLVSVSCLESDIAIVPHVLQARLTRLAESLSGQLSEEGWVSFGVACRAEVHSEQVRLARLVLAR